MKKFYKIILSTKQEFEIDEEDYQKVEIGLATGSFVKIKQCIINPSYITVIFPIQKEAETEIKGHIDEKTGKFIVTTYKENLPEVKNQFSDDIKNLSDSKKI